MVIITLMCACFPDRLYRSRPQLPALPRTFAAKEDERRRERCITILQNPFPRVSLLPASTCVPADHLRAWVAPSLGHIACDAAPGFTCAVKRNAL